MAWHPAKADPSRIAARQPARRTAARRRSQEDLCNDRYSPSVVSVGKRLRSFAAWFAIASSAGLGPGAAFSEDVLKASPLGPSTHLLNAEVLLGWADAVGQVTHGRVRIEVLARAVAPPPKLLDAVRGDTVDVAILSTGASETPLPLNRLVEFAGQTIDAERASVAYQRVLARYPVLTDEFGGVEVLAAFTHGPGALLLVERGTAIDGTLSQARLHVGGSGAAEAARSMGAQVVPAPGPAAKGLLEEGRADGTVTAIETLQSFDLLPHIHRVVVMPGGFYTAGFTLVVNDDRWNALDAADRAAILGISGEALARRAGQAWDRADAEALRAAERRGVPVTEASADLVQRVRSANLAREDAWVAGAGALAIDARNALAEYRREIERSPSNGLAR